MCFGGGLRKLKLMQLACFSEGGEGKKYIVFAHVWRYHVIISYRSACFFETALKFGIRYKAKQSCIAKLYKQHECTLNRFEFLVLYWG